MSNAVFVLLVVFFFFFKQKTAYEILRSDWSSDVCSSDLRPCRRLQGCIQHLSFGQGILRIGRAERLEKTRAKPRISPEGRHQRQPDLFRDRRRKAYYVIEMVHQMREGHDLG